MSRMASPGSALPGGYILGALSHADRIGLVYEAFPAEGRGAKARALVLHPLHLDDLREWFEGAAVLGRSLSHPNLIDVHAVGYTVNDLPVLVSEWTDGRTLRSRIAGGEVIPAAEVVRVIDQVASALDYLHARDPAVIHRVVMPETVLVQPSPLPVKVLAVGHADRPQHPASKPNYLAPEELEGRHDLTPAADVFSLASLAFEALTGRAAFPGNGAAAILAAVQRGALPFVALGPQEGLEPLDELFHHAWALDPAARPRSASAFAEGLSAAIDAVPATLLTQRRTVRETVVRAATIPPGSLAPLAPTGAYDSPAATAARVTARVSASSFRAPSMPAFSRPPTPRPGTLSAPGRPPRAFDDELAAWRTFDREDSRPTVTEEPSDPGASEVWRDPNTPGHGPLDVGDAVISSTVVDLDDPEVLDLLSEDFTNPAIGSHLPAVAARRASMAPPPSVPEAPTPAPPPPAPSSPLRAATIPPMSRPPMSLRPPTQPRGLPSPSPYADRPRTGAYPDRGLAVPSDRRSLAPRPSAFDRSPVEHVRHAPPPPVADPRGADRELRLTPKTLAAVLLLNLVVTTVVVLVVLRLYR